MPKKFYCARCGFPVDKGHRIVSRHTGYSYCFGLVDCQKRSHDVLTFEEIAMYAEALTAQLEKQ